MLPGMGQEPTEFCLERFRFGSREVQGNVSAGYSVRVVEESHYLRLVSVKKPEPRPAYLNGLSRASDQRAPGDVSDPCKDSLVPRRSFAGESHARTVVGTIGRWSAESV
jgi:hypothetical protein